LGFEEEEGWCLRKQVYKRSLEVVQEKLLLSWWNYSVEVMEKEVNEDCQREAMLTM